MSGQPFQIFISYRREDSADAAGRLYDALAAEFGDRIFMDIDTIEPGVDFVDVVHRAVGSCDVLLALIGHRWTSVADAKGRRRLDKPDDFVRMEIEAALGRDVRVIPVLVQDAEMPGVDELPDSLARLARRNAVQISPARWHYDVGRLIENLHKLANDRITPPEVVTEPSPAPVPSDAADVDGRRRRIMVGAVAALLAGAAGVFFLLHRGTGAATTSAGPSTSVAAAGGVPPPPHSVVKIDPETGKVLANVPNPGGAGFVGKDLATGHGSAWVTGNLGVARISSDDLSSTLIRLDDPSDLGVGTSGVWVTDGDHVFEIDRDTGALGPPLSVGVAPRRIAVGSLVWVLTSGPTAGSQRDELVRINEDETLTHLTLPGSDVVVPTSGVWVADTAGSRVFRIDRELMTVAETVTVPQGLDGIAPGQQGVWVYNTDAGTVTEIQETDGVAVLGTPIPIFRHPIDLSLGQDALWTANRDGSVSKVVEGAVQTFDLGAPVVAIRVESSTNDVFALIG